MNGLSVCIDEIALEGLDGITLSTLWRRLSDATTCLQSTLDDSYKEYLWGSIRSSQNIQTFLLQQSRLELHDLYDDLKCYPYCNINDPKTGVRGSCSSFYSREPVNLLQKSLKDVVETYGDRIVLVASQLLRERALFGPDADPSVDVSDAAYCILEWVGRSRRNGRLQSAIVSYTGLERSAHFHQVKILQKLQIVTKQSVMTGDGVNNKSCIIYLTRFHIEHGRDSLRYRISSLIGATPKKCMSIECLCSHLDEQPDTVKMSLQDLCKTGHVQYLIESKNQLEAGESAFDHELGDDMPRKQNESIVQLLRPFYNASCFDNNNDDDDDLEEEEEEEVFTGCQESALQVHAEIPLICFIYQFIASKGLDGATITECIKQSGLSYLDIRSALLLLECQQKATVIFEDIGRQRIQRYVASKILKPSPNVSEEIPKEEDLPMEFEEALTEIVTTESYTDTAHQTKVFEKTTSILEAAKNNFSGFTEKFQKRRGIVVDYLKKVKVVEGDTTFRKLITKEELENGITGRIDKRTVCRLLDKLRDTGAIQIFNFDVVVKGENHKLVLYCDSKMKEDSPEVLVKISMRKEELETKKVKQMETNKKEEKAFSLNGIGNRRGFLPKMPRCELLHIFLFYLLYELSKPHVKVEYWQQKFDWTKHLTPEHSLKDFGRGWFTATTIVMLLPLSLYVKLVGVSFQADVLGQYFKNPETKHMLVRDLPPLVKHYLTAKNRHFTLLLETLSLMSAMKLITPTTKIPFQFAKDIACHLNQSAVLMDTRESLPAYAHVKHPEGKPFSETVFEFSSLADVEQYWAMTRDICLSTHLNSRGASRILSKQKKRLTLREYVIDEESVHISIKPPGDALGAAGFDSSLFCHLRQNWVLNLGDENPMTFLLDDASDESPLDWRLCFSTTNIPAENVPKNSGGRGVKRKNKQLSVEKAEKKRKILRKVAKKKEIFQQSGLQAPVSYKGQQICHPTVSQSKVLRRASNVHMSQSSFSEALLTTSETCPDAQTSIAIEEGISYESCYAQPKIEAFVQKKQLSKKTKAKKKSAIKAKKAKANAKKKKRQHWNKIIHDKRDLEAALQKKSDRVSFNAKEEKLLFICTLALRILGKTSSDTSYSDWLWTRDVLYKDDYESAKTKTALCISRKYRNIMKNPQTKVNINICTADCVQEKQFQPYCNLGKSCKQEGFNKLVEMLKMRYSTENLETKILCLPHNLRTIRKQASLQSTLQSRIAEKTDRDIRSLKKPVASVSDIRQSILRDSIISAVLQEDETYDPSVSYAFLGQFTEDELSLAIGELKKKRIIVRKSLRYGQGKSQALSAFSQRLSAPGRHILESHFPSGVVSEAVSFYHQILQGGPHSRQYVANSDVEEPGCLTLSAESTMGGHVACILSLLATEQLSVEIEIPEDVLQVHFAEKGGVKENLTISCENKGQDFHPTAETNDDLIEKNTNMLTKGSTHSIMKNDNYSTNKKLAMPYENYQIATQAEGEETEKKTVDHVDQTTESHLVKELTSAPTLPSSISGNNLQEVLELAMMHQPESHEAEHISDVSLKEIVDRDIQVRSKELINRKTIVKKKFMESSVGSNAHLTNQGPFVDILSGIEDHLFGACGAMTSSPMYVVDIWSKPSFNCHLTTTSIDPTSERNHHGNLVCNIQRVVNTSYSTTSEYYNEMRGPARVAGSLLKAVIRYNPCTIRLRLLPLPAKDPCSKVTDDARQHVAEYFKAIAHVMPQNVNDCVSVCSKYFGYSEEDCQAVTAVYECIASSKEVGLMCSEVDDMIKMQGFPATFRTEGLIDVLKAFKLVFEVGFVGSRFVTQTFKKPWCLTFPCVEADRIVEDTKQQSSCASQTDGTAITDNMRSQEAVSTTTERKTDDLACIHIHEDDLSENQIIGRKNNGQESSPSNAKEQNLPKKAEASQLQPVSCPWFCMNGKVNKKAYNTFHESVLRYVIRYPGVKEYVIAKHFINMIYPVALHAVLQRLEDHECIEKRVFNQRKVTIFSSNTLRNEDVERENKVTYFIPAVDAVTKLIRHVFL